MIINSFSPIVLFVYNRPRHTKQVLEALRNNQRAKESSLIVYSDGARAQADIPKVNEVRSYIRSVQGFKSVKLIEREVNYGLSRSIIEGVSDALSKFNSVIVLEDDLVTSPYFLSYMNQGLELYGKEEKVISIHGYVYPVKDLLPETFFLRGADCWGWATWRRGWRLFETDGVKLLRALHDQGLTRKFNFNNTYNFAKLLEDQIRGKKDSWAIRWYASAFLAGKLTLYPRRSLVQNIGFDKSGTNVSYFDLFRSKLEMDEIKVFPISIEENRSARDSIAEFFRTRWNIPFYKIGMALLGRIKQK